MSEVEKLEIGEYQVTIDPQNLKFSEETLTVYIQKESAFYDNFGAFLTLAEKNLQIQEIRHEKLYCERFVEAKENGSSDKLAEAKAKCDMDVVILKEDMVEARYIVNRLKQHLKAWDKNHENAQSLGHYQRKAMDKLHGDIYAKDHFIDRTIEQSIERKAEQEFMKKVVKTEPANSGPAEFETELSMDNLF